MISKPQGKLKGKPHVGPMLRLVLGVGALLSPLAGPLLKRRLKRGKEDAVRWVEKLGEPTQPRPDGPLIWLHGVGVGEVMALRGLIERLSAARPELNFLVTSSARSSGAVFAKNRPVNTIHQYLPLDLPKGVGLFLDHWRPDLAVWSDQEIWPRMAVTVARRGIPQAYVAARITDASAKAKTRFGAAYGDLFRLLDLRHAQEDRTAAHLSNLIGDDSPVSVTGSLKAASAPLTFDAAALVEVQTLQAPMWLVASAHRADVGIALDAYGIMLTEHGLISTLIIAPRALDDVAYIEEMANARGLTYTTRSKGAPSISTQVLIADSYGDLGTWYRAADAALIGGSFNSTQGHNPWEAVALDCAVLHGPNVQNFATDYATLHDATAAKNIATANDLAAALLGCDLKAMAQRASAVRDRAADGVDHIVTDLLALLDRAP